MTSEQKPFLVRNRIIIIPIIISISLVLSVLVYLNFTVEPVVTVAVNEPIQKELEPAKDTRFNVANFDRCVGLLVDYTGVHDSTDEATQVLNEIKKSDILVDYYDLSCNLVENQLSQTDAYKNRNALP